MFARLPVLSMWNLASSCHGIYTVLVESVKSPRTRPSNCNGSAETCLYDDNDDDNDDDDEDEGEDGDGDDAIDAGDGDDDW